MAAKIAVVGNVNGQYPAVFQKLGALQEKQNFAFALVVGNLFADPATSTEEDEKNLTSLINGNIKVPFTTYFALAGSSFPPSVVARLEANADDICENLHFLGKRSVMKTSEGIRIVTLGGHLDPNIIAGESKDKYPPYYSETDAKILRGAVSADILITHEWPTGIRNRSKNPFDAEQEPQSQQCLADLATVLKPKYHFSAASEAFYEREPFFHVPSEETENLYPITRFISLASYGNPNKQKWIYAFSLDPKASNPVSPPENATASPLIHSDKKRSAAQEYQGSGLVYETSSRGGGGRGRPNKRRRGNAHNRHGPLSASECFFCLANPDTATHLVTSIGDASYLTTAKGPLPTPTTYPKLGFPSHILIIPFEHQPTLAAMPEDERHVTYAEMVKYRSAMNAMLKSRAGNDLGSITWEVSKASLPHTHWQYLPVEASLIRSGLVEAGFKALAENLHWPSIEKADVGDGVEETTDFFRFVLWDPEDEVETSFVMRFDERIKFHNQFGREVLAKLMALDNRVDWHECGQTQQEEEADVAAFKTAFEEFDFA
ncbi:hypothetical protein BU24DRAFT_497942 [Aaosphaeria arxii CBS 175.79]|uniref:CwfJ domain-containing protein n=1 Tax=Aaosphaeria arxii CBS 175.79 TaxID=1450172 RepID=A0A6A5X6C1_9PLEO|nr:uncharacterized protein BU24DRAFT_497942 [Aaosphaeria arxii CBS 175.79]KAF2008499.1 hypothetical protein BU24DRAFT_497942 [Aaosphaeria arxii CBS 175.79]